MTSEQRPPAPSAATHFDLCAGRFGLELVLAEGDEVLRRQLHAELLAEVGPERYAEAIHVAMLVIIDQVVRPFLRALGPAESVAREQIRLMANIAYVLNNAG